MAPSSRYDQDAQGVAGREAIVAGASKTFFHDPAGDRLSRATGRLSHGQHREKVVAGYATGNAATRIWTFRVVGGR